MARQVQCAAEYSCCSLPWKRSLQPQKPNKTSHNFQDNVGTENPNCISKRLVFKVSDFCLHTCSYCAMPLFKIKPSKPPFAGVPQTRQQISAVSRPKFTILSGHVEVLLFNKFFPIVDTCLRFEDIALQSRAMVPKWRFFCVLYFQRAACSTFQTCILNSD